MRETAITLPKPTVHGLRSGTVTQLRIPVAHCQQFADWEVKPANAYHVLVSDQQDGAAFLVAGDHGYTDWIECPLGKPGDRILVQEDSPIVLEFLSLQVELLQEIDEHDALREVSGWVHDERCETARDGVRVLWDETHEPGERWADDPWCWIVGVRLLEGAKPA